MDDEARTVGDAAHAHRDGVDADASHDFSVRLHGRRAQLWAFAGLLVLLVVVCEAVAASQGALAHWWWPPLLIGALAIWMLVRAQRGVLVRSDGSDLVIKRVVERRVPASTICHIETAGPLGERVEVLCSSGRTWVIQTLESEEADRDRLVAEGSAWLDQHGGPASLESDALHDGELIGWRPLWWNSPAGVLCMYEALVVVGMGARIISRPQMPRVELVGLALLQVLIMMVVVVLVQRARPAGEVHGGQLCIRPTLGSVVRIPAQSITAIQVVVRPTAVVTRVRSQGRWWTRGTGMMSLDRPVPVLRLERWARERGATLEFCDELPPRWGRSDVVPMVAALLGMILALWVTNSHNGGWGGLAGGLIASLGGFGRGQTAIDVSDLAPDRPVGRSLRVDGA